VKVIVPYVEAQRADGSWTRVSDDIGFPAGLLRTMVADLTGKLPPGTRRIRIWTNLKIYWDQVLIDTTPTVHSGHAHRGPARGRLALAPRLPARDPRHARGRHQVRLRTSSVRPGPTRGIAASTRSSAT
jgi:hypothetical protein